jgi:hypothetical protein
VAGVTGRLKGPFISMTAIARYKNEVATYAAKY